MVGNWAFFAIDEIGDLALSFHLDSHPVAVARLTRFLVQHDVPFVLHEAFTVDDDDQHRLRVRHRRRVRRGQEVAAFIDVSAPFCYPRKLVVGW